MTDSRAAGAIKRMDALRTVRAPHESLWQELAEYVRPLRTGFTSPARAGEKPPSRLFDGTAPMAADRLAGGLYGMVTNPANEWFSIRHQMEEMNQIQAVTLWCGDVERRIRQELLSGGLGFYSRVFQLYADLAAFGTAVFYIDEDVSRGRLWFSHRHLSECLIAENDREEVDTVLRVFTWTARQAMARWGEAAGRAVAAAVEKGETERPIQFLHAVEPNPDFDPRRADARGKPYRSLYVGLEDRALIAVGGYDEFPYQVPRWARAETGAYGQGPALLALADAKMVNAMAKTNLIGAQKAVDPPLLAPDEYAVRGLRTTPGAITFGGVDMAGNPLIRPMTTGGRIDIGLELEEQRRAAIREAFHSSLMLMVGSPNRTATEVLEAKEEKLRLMAPHLGNIQSEFLDPALDRVFGLLLRAGRLPPPPDVLAANPGLRVEYVSPLARAAKAAEGAAVVRTLEAVGPLAQVDPGVMDNFDADAIARGLAESYGMPPRMLRDPKAIEEMRAARAQAQAQAEMVNATPTAARALKDLSQSGVLPQ